MTHNLDEPIRRPERRYFISDIKEPEQKHQIISSPRTVQVQQNNTDDKDEIIAKYENVLKDLNSEFRQLFKRNRYLEEKLEQKEHEYGSNDKATEINELKANQISQTELYKVEVGKQINFLSIHF